MIIKFERRVTKIKQLTVIVPIYNVEKYLHRCVDSILNQTFSDFELILVDDGSPDNCGAICDEYAKKDKRIKVIHKENGGLSDARNAGLDIAEGEYVSFIDGDDFIHNQTYEFMLNLMNENNAGIGCFNYQFIKTNEKENEVKYEYDEVKSKLKIIDSKNFLSNFNEYYHAVSWISACTKIYQRIIFERLRFPYGKVDEDSYMLHHVVSKTKKIIRTDTTFYYYVWTEGSISRSAFSPKRFDKNGANLDRVEFFKSKGIKKQENFFKRLYLLNTLKMYYEVKNEHPEFLKDYKKHILEYKKNLKDFIRENETICNMEKVIYNLFSINPKFAEGLYNKYLK